MPEPRFPRRLRTALAATLMLLTLLIAGKLLLGHVRLAREEQLAQALILLRDSLQQYRADFGHYPQRLDELVSAKYLRQLPKDPLTDSHDAWLLVRPDGDSISNVFSSAAGSDENGLPYQRW